MTNLRNIKLGNIIIRWFFLYSLLFSTKNIATNHDKNEEPIYIITDSRPDIAYTTTEKYIVCGNRIKLLTISHMLRAYNDLRIYKYIYILLSIIGSIYTSLYNYFTGHNKIKNGWYHGKFFVYFGRKKNIYLGKKTNITKNFHEDLYFSLLNFCANLFEFLYITRKLGLLIAKTISCDINIRIYKNFYFCFNLISLFRIFFLHIERSSVRRKTTKYLLISFPNLPENFNLSNIHCKYTDPQEPKCLFYINTDNF